MQTHLRNIRNDDFSQNYWENICHICHEYMHFNQIGTWPNMIKSINSKNTLHSREPTDMSNICMIINALLLLRGRIGSVKASCYDNDL